MHFVFPTYCPHLVPEPLSNSTTRSGNHCYQTFLPLPALLCSAPPRAILGASTSITYLFALSLIIDAGMAGGKDERNHMEMGPLPLPKQCASL